MSDKKYPIYEIRHGYPGVIIGGSATEKPEHWRDRDVQWALCRAKERTSHEGAEVRIFNHENELIETHIYEPEPWYPPWNLHEK